MKKLLTLFLCCFLAITVTTVEAGNPSNNKKKVTLKTTPYKALGAESTLKSQSTINLKVDSAKLSLN